MYELEGLHHLLTELCSMPFSLNRFRATVALWGCTKTEAEPLQSVDSALRGGVASHPVCSTQWHDVPFLNLRFGGITSRLWKEEEKVKQPAVCFCVSLCQFECGFVGPLHWERSGSWWHSVLPSVENKEGAQWNSGAASLDMQWS